MSLQLKTQPKQQWNYDERTCLSFSGKMLGLPEEFLAMTPPKGPDGIRGGGVIQVYNDVYIVVLLFEMISLLPRLLAKPETLLADVANTDVNSNQTYCASTLQIGIRYLVYVTSNVSVSIHPFI